MSDDARLVYRNAVLIGGEVMVMSYPMRMQSSSGELLPLTGNEPTEYVVFVPLPDGRQMVVRHPSAIEFEDA